MTKESVSIISTLVNLFLALLKLVVGLLSRSAALIADGIHSGLDIISSGITYLGIKAAKKPADIEHPYGHYRWETITGLVITGLLLVSAIWIIYEGIASILEPKILSIGLLAIFVTIISIIINGLIARLKFIIGKKTDNLALIADAQHSQADAISSIGVLVGLILTRFFVWADGITAILVGLYIVFETWLLFREVTDNLLDIANPEVEKQIRDICQQQEIELLELRTRKIGPQNFAELKIGLAKDWKMQKVEEIIRNLENLLRQKIASLSFVVIQAETHDLKRGYIKSSIGQIQHFKEQLPKINFKKIGRRAIIPLDKDNKISPTFGAYKYLVIDQKDNQIMQKKTIVNPYFVIGRGHGVRFAREIGADEIITTEIGQSAKGSFENLGISIKILPEEKIYKLL